MTRLTVHYKIEKNVDLWCSLIFKLSATNISNLNMIFRTHLVCMLTEENTYFKYVFFLHATAIKIKKLERKGERKIIENDIFLICRQSF